MKEHPIIMSGPSVLATLAGRKTQTRRVVKLQPDAGPNGTMVDLGGGWGLLDGVLSGEWCCPYGQPGDRLWVRETWTADFGGTFSDNRDAWWHEMPASLRTSKATQWIYYHADDSVYHGPWARSPDLPVEASRSGWEPTERDLEGRRWKSPIHMPRWASRITLEVTEVRCQRLHAITDSDLVSEGVDERTLFQLAYCPRVRSLSDERYYDESDLLRGSRGAFALAWDILNAKRGYSWTSNPWVWAITFEVVP